MSMRVAALVGVALSLSALAPNVAQADEYEEPAAAIQRHHVRVHVADVRVAPVCGDAFAVSGSIDAGINQVGASTCTARPLPVASSTCSTTALAGCGCAAPGITGQQATISTEFGVSPVPTTTVEMPG